MRARNVATWFVAVALSFCAALFASSSASAATQDSFPSVSSDMFGTSALKGSSGEWVEANPVSSSQGAVVGFRDASRSATFLDCVNRLQQESLSSGSTGSWNFIPCEEPDMVACTPTECTGHILDGVSEATYTLFDVSNSINTRSLVDGCGGPQGIDCITAAGCVVTTGADGALFIGCPFSMTEVGTLTVDMSSWRERTSPSPSPTENTSALATEGFMTAASRGQSGDAGSWSERTSLSDVRLIGDPAQEALRVAATAGASVVLIILVMLPTQLINSTLEENDARIRGWFRRRGSSREGTGKSAPTAIAGARRDATSVRTKRRGPDWAWGIPVLLLAAIMTGFADPQFGLTLSSLRLVLTAFVTFLVLNYVGTVLVWLILRKRESAALPTIRVHYLYLVIIAVTVILTRLLHFQPALVFGVVLAIEATRVAANIADQRAEDKSIGRMQFAIAVVTVVMGFAAWLIFNAVVMMAPLRAVAPPELLNVMVTVQETFAAFTIEALTTLPILMLPLRFMPGSLVFRWSKVAWAITFGVAVTLFFFVLVPMPNSWSTVSIPFVTWIIALLAYVAFAVLLWAGFRFTRRKGSRH